MENEEEGQEFFDGNLKEDIEKFEAFLKGNAIGFIDNDRWEHLIDYLLLNGHFKNAIICAKEALTQFSFNSLFKLRLAQAYSATGRLKDAINMIAEIEQQGESSFEIIITKASIFSQLKDAKNAIRFFKEGLKLAEKEDKDEIYLDLSVELQNDGKFKEAIEVLKEAIAVNPNNESAIYEIAFCYDQIGNHESSIECYSNFIDENPYSFTSWYNLGNAYSKIENFEKAIWAYDYCILINENFGPVYFNNANAYLSLDKYTKAIENFHKCMELDGDDPIAFCYIGECHEQLGELELAQHFYNKSLELAPLLPDAWLGLGIVKDLQGNTREGLTFIRKAIELDPENAGMYHVLAGAHEKLNEIIEATDFYELSLAMDPSDEECLLNYVNLMIEQESLLSAFGFIDVFEDNVNLIKPVLEVNLLWKMGNRTEALTLYQECLLKGKQKAMELFEIYPEYKSIREFIELAE